MFGAKPGPHQVRVLQLDNFLQNVYGDHLYEYGQLRMLKMLEGLRMFDDHRLLETHRPPPPHMP